MPSDNNRHDDQGRAENWYDLTIEEEEKIIDELLKDFGDRVRETERLREEELEKNIEEAVGHGRI